MTKRPAPVNPDPEPIAAVSTAEEGGEIGDEPQLSEDASPEAREIAEKNREAFKQFHENLALNMRRLRRENDWNVSDLARMIGVSSTHLGAIEHKKQSVSLRHLILMAYAFDVEPMALLSPASYMDQYIKNVKRDGKDNKKSWYGLPVVDLDSFKLPSQNHPVRPPPEDAFFGSRPSALPLTASAETLSPVEAVLGSGGAPFSLATVSRIVGAAYKRIEALKRKHGSVQMTRAMLNNVLAAVLSASHDTDDECDDEHTTQPPVGS